MKIIIIISILSMLSGCGLISMTTNSNGGFHDSRWEGRSRRIELAKNLVGKHKSDVIALFGNPNPRNLNSDGGKASLVRGDPYEEWITSEEEWVYQYYDGGIPLINSVNYWISFHFIDHQVVTIDY